MSQQLMNCAQREKEKQQDVNCYKILLASIYRCNINQLNNQYQTNPSIKSNNHLRKLPSHTILLSQNKPTTTYTNTCTGRCAKHNHHDIGKQQQIYKHNTQYEKKPEHAFETLCLDYRYRYRYHYSPLLYRATLLAKVSYREDAGGAMDWLPAAAAAAAASRSLLDGANTFESPTSDIARN
jgi:hypothetical protein